MKIAVTYDNGNVFQHFGKTENFKVYEVEDNKVVSSEVMERVEVDSASGRRMLYPPEIRMTFVPGTRLKTRIAEKGEAGDE